MNKGKSLQDLEQRINSVENATFSTIESEIDFTPSSIVCEFAKKLTVTDEASKLAMVACAFRLSDITLLDRSQLVQFAAQIKPVSAIKLFADHNRLDEIKVIAQRAAQRAFSDSINDEKLTRLNRIASTFDISFVGQTNVRGLTFLAENRPDLLKKPICVVGYDPEYLVKIHELGLMEKVDFTRANATETFLWFLDNPKAIVTEVILSLARRVTSDWKRQKTTSNDRAVEAIISTQLLSPQEVGDILDDLL